ncbi:MAG: carboxypeptidase regulatory-like domain-containing protein [Pyrinomonadaceae bacterium]
MKNKLLGVNRRSILLFAIALLFAAASAANGQATGGAVTGTANDSNGAVVPNVAITIVNKSNGLKLTTQTSSTGSYNFPNVSVGTYTLTAESPNFAATSQEIKVSLNQTITAEIVLQAKGVQASVNISADSEVLVQTDSSQLGKSFESRQVTDLPTFNNQNQLALLAPNVVERAAGVRGTGGAVGGTRPRGNAFTVDGVDNNDPSVTGPINGVIQDSIQEFTLLTNNYNAEFGSGTGGQFNTITKAGTNRFSGSVFYYPQREKFNAASTQTGDAINNGSLTKKPAFSDDRYGFTFGGPIVKNKLFFFGAYEREKTASEGSTYTFVAPTAAGLTRIAALPGASAYIVNLLKTYTTQAATQSFLQPVLAPSVDCTATPANANCIPFGNASVLAPNGATNNQYLINIDYSPNGNNQFRFRYNDQMTKAEQVGGSQGGGAAVFNNLVDFKSRLFSTTWIRTINSSLVNDLRLSFRHHAIDYPLKDSKFNSFPTWVDAETGIDFGPGGSLPQGTPVDVSYQIFDALNYIRGSHTIKFGGEFRDLITTGLFLPRSRGDYIYGSFDELILDAVPSFSALRGVGSAEFVGNQLFFNAFAQDDWKIRSNLTLNLGIRYDFSTLPRSSKLQGRNAIASVPGVIEFGVPKNKKLNFGPRVGFAYSPSGDGWLWHTLFGTQGQSSIRANFAMSYYANFQNLPTIALPPQVQTELNPAVAGTNPALPFLQNGGLPGTLPVITDAATARRITQSRIPDQITPYSLAFSVSYQRELTRSMGIEFRYLHTSGFKLPIQIRLNGGVVPSNLGLPTFLSQPTAAQLAGLTNTLGAINALRKNALAQYGFAANVTEHSPVGRSDYDSGSVTLTRRFANNLSLTAAYTFSKTMDDSTNELNSSAINPRRAQDGFNIKNERGLSALDVPHRFVTSFLYDVPFFNKSGNRVAKALLGGWQVNGIFQAQNGQPFTPLSGIDSNRNGDSAGDRTIVNPNGTVGTGSSVRAINAAGQTVASGSATVVAYVANNPNAQYIQAGLGAIATAGRNTLRSKGYNRTDMSLLKNFGISETMRVQFGAEISDFFNQRTPTITSGASGLETNTSFGNVNSPNFNDYSIGDFQGRAVTFRFKFIF